MLINAIVAIFLVEQIVCAIQAVQKSVDVNK
jgi:hypothetical protein